jgi:hypothetical protein
VNRLLIGVVVTATAWSAPTMAQGPPDTVRLLDRFPVGELLRYDARFGFITVGHAAMEVAGVDTIRGIPTLQFTFTLQGGTLFFRLNNRMDSWVGLADFASRRFRQDFDEMGKRRQARFEIYPDSGFYRDLVADTVLPTSPHPLDDAAFFYFVRTVSLEPGRRYEFNRYFRPDRNPVVLEVLERDTVDVPAGRFPTVVIRPTVKGRGILAEAQDPRMWLSDDDRRIMVQLKSRFSFGTITLRLTGRESARSGEPSEGR